MAAIVAHDSLGLSRRSRRVQQVQRVGGLDRYAGVWLCHRHGVIPVDVATVDHAGRNLGPLQNDAMRWFVRREIDRFVEQRFVLNQARGLDTAGCGDDGLGFRVIDARCQFGCCKATEHD